MIYPLINANAYEVVSCSIRPDLVTEDDKLRIELIYTAAIVNNTEKCIEEEVINYKVENKVLNYSTNFTLNKWPGGVGKHWGRVFILISA